MCLFPEENQQPVLGSPFFQRKVTICIGRETKTHILQTKINEKTNSPRCAFFINNYSFRRINQSTTTTTTIIHSGEAPLLTSEEPPPHSGELKHALPQAGGPTQSQLSRPMSSGHHISMEHRLRRKQLNSDTNASNKTYLKEIQEKRKEENFFF